ncbi:MAG: hypothetical protein M9963_12120 [Kiritimatiellae bacterium]|nr:hypothetical protein [Kiritimatiellia bacterium]MCO5068571.1 hypothetical protein [Kiritimatiellia bacterium]
MNIFELLTVLFVAAAGYFCGKYFGGNYGVIGWIGGFIAGVFLAVMAYCGFRRLIGITKGK